MRIWIDLDNTPHVPFFKPVITELEKRGHTVVLTARDAFQVCDLAQHLRIDCLKIGRHVGRNTFLKIVGWIVRALQLMPIGIRRRPQLALSHGARSQIFAANVLRIPTVAFDDYEHSKWPPLAHPKWLIVPKAIQDEAVATVSAQIRHYLGIKEDVYACSFVPDSSILEELGLNEEHVIVTARPPATEAHYHNPESLTLLSHFMDRTCAETNVRVVLLPRNREQERQLRQRWPHWFSSDKVIIPRIAVNGLNLLWHSDLVVSGGGTMNREAAALGIPVFSIFKGKIGAVDRQLEKEGRLVMIPSIEAMDQKIRFQRRAKDIAGNTSGRTALEDIMNHLEDIMALL
jgi:uncharacterized protein